MRSRAVSGPRRRTYGQRAAGHPGGQIDLCSSPRRNLLLRRLSTTEDLLGGDPPAVGGGGGSGPPTPGITLSNRRPVLVAPPIRLCVLAFETQTESFFAKTAKGCDRDTLFNEERPVPRGNTEPFRSIGWVTAPAPFSTSERGRDSQRDRSTNHGGSNPGALASEAGALPTVPR